MCRCADTITTWMHDRERLGGGGALGKYAANVLHERYKVGGDQTTCV